MISNHFLKEALKLFHQYGRVTAPLLVRKFKLRWEYACKLQNEVALIQHEEARKLAKRVDVN